MNATLVQATARLLATAVHFNCANLPVPGIELLTPAWRLAQHCARQHEEPRRRCRERGADRWAVRWCDRHWPATTVTTASLETSTTTTTLERDSALDAFIAGLNELGTNPDGSHR